MFHNRGRILYNKNGIILTIISLYPKPSEKLNDQIEVKNGSLFTDHLPLMANGDRADTALSDGSTRHGSAD